MSLKIRLSRGGAKKHPFYRIVVTDSRNPRDGRFIERVGTYDPMLKRDDPNRVKLNIERIQHWMGHGAKPTDRVARFLGHAEVIPMPAIPEQTKKNQPRPKTVERMKAAEEAKTAAAEAATAEAATAAAAPAEEPATEAPAEEPATEAPAEEPAAEEPTAEAAPAEDAPAEDAPAEEEKSEG